MPNAARIMPTAIASLALCISAGGSIATAEDLHEYASSFSRIEGGAIYDYKTGVDGAAVSEEYDLLRVICTDGSKSLRVMLPVSPEYDGYVSYSDGPKSTLEKKRGSYWVTFLASGRNIRKALELKAINDPKSNNGHQFVVRVDYGDRLWKALTSGEEDAAVMLIGLGGTPVIVPEDPKLDAALKSCGLKTAS
jgi:hypothetical protein